MTSSAADTGKVSIRLIFENDSREDITVSLHSRIEDLRQQVCKSLPEGLSAVRGPEQIRLIAMGRVLNQDALTIKAANLHKFDFPTPIHVSVVPLASLERKEKAEQCACVGCTVL
jgi:hypothetical protein